MTPPGATTPPRSAPSRVGATSGSPPPAGPPVAPAGRCVGPPGTAPAGRPSAPAAGAGSRPAAAAPRPSTPRTAAAHAGPSASRDAAYPFQADRAPGKISGDGKQLPGG